MPGIIRRVAVEKGQRKAIPSAKLMSIADQLSSDTRSLPLRQHGYRP